VWQGRKRGFGLSAVMRLRRWRKQSGQNVCFLQSLAYNQGVVAASENLCYTFIDMKRAGTL
jgi:hypothetical protein